jgi:hypothetical protein
MDEIFYPADSIPILELKDSKKIISLEEFIVAWSYLANRDYKLCYESLYAIGYEGTLENTFGVT